MAIAGKSLEGLSLIPPVEDSIIVAQVSGAMSRYSDSLLSSRVLSIHEYLHEETVSSML